MTDEPVSRVRITSPRTAGARPRSRQSHAAEIDALSRVGEVYVQSLMRAQLRLATYVVLLLAVTVGLLPVLLHGLHAGDVRVLHVPLPWLVLGVLVYPWVLVLAWWYVRRAEHNEAAFVDLVGQHPPGAAEPPEEPR